MKRLAPLLLALASAAHAEATKEMDAPVQVDASAITFARERQPTDVTVRVANPTYVYRLEQVQTGSTFAGPPLVMKLKVGAGLAAGAPLVWNRYFSVRTDGAAGVPTIEMQVGRVAGKSVIDLSHLSSPTTTMDLDLGLSCKLLDAAGREIDRFDSTQRYSGTTPTTDTTLYQVPSHLMEKAFDEILAKFFASPRVAAALKSAKTTPAVANKGLVAVLDFKNKLKGSEREAVDAAYVSDLVRSAVLESVPGMQVMTRENVLVLLKSAGKSLEDCEGECEVDTGRRLGADYVISGEVLKFGSNLKVNLKLHETHDGRLLGATQASGSTIDDLDKAMGPAVAKLVKPLS